MSRTNDYGSSDYRSESRDYTEDTRKDPATLEREIDQTRAEMDRTLGALERKLSPGQLLDEALGHVKGHGGDFVANLANSIKQNPVPVILTAVGIGWMMMSDRQRASGRYSYGGAGSHEQVESNNRSTSSTVGAVREKMSEAGEGFKSGAEVARRKVAESREAVEGRVEHSREVAAAQVQRARDGFNHMLEQQPLILGVIGVALGATIGSALPATKQEDRLIGPLRDEVASNIQQRGAESLEPVKETASHVGEESRP